MFRLKFVLAGRSGGISDFPPETSLHPPLPLETTPLGLRPAGGAGRTSCVCLFFGMRLEKDASSFPSIEDDSSRAAPCRRGGPDELRMSLLRNAARKGCIFFSVNRKRHISGCALPEGQAGRAASVSSSECGSKRMHLLFRQSKTTPRPAQSKKQTCPSDRNFLKKFREESFKGGTGESREGLGGKSKSPRPSLEERFYKH